MSAEVTAETISDVAALHLDWADAQLSHAAHLARRNQERWGSIEDVRQLQTMQPYLPQLPDTAAGEVYEAICAYERELAAPGLHRQDYGEGTAEDDDQLVIFGEGPVLMEAQHATDPVRKASGKREAADHGTAGLTAVLAMEGLGRAIVPRGRQTGNANVDIAHPIKEALTTELENAPYGGVLSVHGMRPGKVVTLEDPTEVHAVLGLGLEPSEASRAVAERIVRGAQGLDLKILIGNDTPHLNFKNDPRWDGRSFRDLGDEIVTDEDGMPKLSRLAAASRTSVATYVTAQTQGRLPVAQLEISRSLRLTPEDHWVRQDHRAAVMGVYLGYCLTVLAAEAYDAGHATMREL